MIKTFKLYTVGCKVNQYDSQLIRESLLKTGLVEKAATSLADLYVINTCTVTQRADRDSLSFIRRVKEKDAQAKICVTGCLAQLDADKIRRIGQNILIVKNKDKNSILDIILEQWPAPEIEIGSVARAISHFKNHTRAFVKIQDGCNNSCSYCKVPLVRGASRSRRPDDVLHEIQGLVNNSFKEIVLCGVCLGLYGKDLKPRMDITGLIDLLEQIKGLCRIRLSSIEASDVTEALIRKISASEKLSPHLHIPIQSGDNRILRKMSRRYSRRQYLELVKKLRKNNPFISITTDCLIGFPGESERNFKNTMSLVEKIQPLGVHIFPYSRRVGTPSANNLNEEIDMGVIKQRIARLRQAAERSSYFFRKKFLGKRMRVLVEGSVRDAAWGHSDNYIKVIFRECSGEKLKNELVGVKIKQIRGGWLEGTLI